MFCFLFFLGGVLGPGAWAAAQGAEGGRTGVARGVTVTVARADEVEVGAEGELRRSGRLEEWVGYGTVAVQFGLSALLAVAAAGGLFLAVLALVGVRDFRQFKKELREEVRGEIGRAVEKSVEETVERELKKRFQAYADDTTAQLYKRTERVVGERLEDAVTMRMPMSKSVGVPLADESKDKKEEPHA